MNAGYKPHPDAIPAPGYRILEPGETTQKGDCMRGAFSDHVQPVEIPWTDGQPIHVVREDEWLQGVCYFRKL